MAYTLGVDFGKKGGLVLLKESQVLSKWAMPVNAENEIDVIALLTVCTEILTVTGGELKVYGEKLHALFKSSAKSTFSFGQAYGTTIGVIESVLAPITLVRAVDWQKHMWAKYETPVHLKAGSKKKDTKLMALITANRIWPSMDWRASSRHRNPHDGIIDAALIGLYGVQHG